MARSARKAEGEPGLAPGSPSSVLGRKLLGGKQAETEPLCLFNPAGHEIVAPALCQEIPEARSRARRRVLHPVDPPVPLPDFDRGNATCRGKQLGRVRLRVVIALSLDGPNTLDVIG
jgi:hypothetical protein